ncbi:sigma-70 family RNA polymerase sigma factor [Streptomyces sp. NPDC001981]|uniref:sigma-70 family RNA polymerase sigma factor n=1 Tax=Streptomyces sp. NPDC001981 TaxID=3364628 RepID=UPI003681D47B
MLNGRARQQEEDAKIRVLLLLGAPHDTELGEVTQRIRREVIASLSTFALSAAEHEDLAEDALLRFLEGDRPVDNPVAYMITIARRLAVKALAVAKAEQLTEDMTSIVSMPASIDDGREESDHTVWGLSEDEELAQQSRRAVRDVPGQSGEVIRARLLEGHSAAQVAQQTGRPANQIYQEYHRGLARVRNAPQIMPYVRDTYVKRRHPQGDSDG